MAGDGGLEKLPQLIESNSASRLIASVDTFNGRTRQCFDDEDDDDEDCFCKYCEKKRNEMRDRKEKYKRKMVKAGEKILNYLL